MRHEHRRALGPGMQCGRHQPCVTPVFAPAHPPQLTLGQRGRRQRASNADLGRRPQQLPEMLAPQHRPHGLAIDAPLTEQRRILAKEIEPGDVGAHPGQLALVPGQRTPAVIGMDQASHEGAHRGCPDDARAQLDLGAQDFPEARLPPATMPATRKDHLVKHAIDPVVARPTAGPAPILPSAPRQASHAHPKATDAHERKRAPHRRRCNLQPATCNLQPATCNLQPAARSPQPAARTSPHQPTGLSGAIIRT